MEIVIERQGNSILFGMRDYEEKYIPIFESCFYQKEEDLYFKKYPADYPYMDDVIRNFKTYGQCMFEQLGYFRSVPWEDALRAFCERTKDSDIFWWLTGSCASCLRGIDFKPHDVDIMIDSKDVENIAMLFGSDLIEPLVDTQGWLTKEFGVLYLGARVDIASDPMKALDKPLPVDCGPYAREHLQKIQWSGYELMIPTVELQLYTNGLRKRTLRVRKLEEYILKQKR